MTRQFVVSACVAIALCGIQSQSVQAMRGDLKRPGIAIPSTGPEGQLDATVVAMNKALQAREKQFAGGHFINAHSVLHFNGGTRTVNALLDELSKIEGAVLRVRFSKESGMIDSPFIDQAKQPKACDCTIDHNGDGDAHELTITIYVGGGGIDLDDIALPAVRGHGDGK
jgi:hypothetical protein